MKERDEGKESICRRNKNSTHGPMYYGLQFIGWTGYTSRDV